MDVLHTIALHAWDKAQDPQIQAPAITALERGEIVHLPHLNFALSEHEERFLSPVYADIKAKNVSFDIHKQQIKGVQGIAEDISMIGNMMKRYAIQAQALIKSLFPAYAPALETARTSFRPVEILGRPSSSYRKDDTRLHVDAFPSSPNQGKRILRIFTNINPHGKNRVWRVGEPFAQVAKKFVPQLPSPAPGSAAILKLLRMTRGHRTRYDHYMLQLHNRMKADLDYQKKARQQTVNFPSGCTWIVFTDCVSHAAMSGQHLFEQTFYVPISAMQDAMKSPLKILENQLNSRLV